MRLGRMSPDLISDTAGGGRCPEMRRREPNYWFEDAGPPPRPTDPVYLLLYPPAPAARQMSVLTACLSREFKLPAQPAVAERLHVSLYGLCRFGRLTFAALGEIRAALAGVTMPPFL